MKLTNDMRNLAHHNNFFIHFVKNCYVKFCSSFSNYIIKSYRQQQIRKILVTWKYLLILSTVDIISPLLTPNLSFVERFAFYESQALENYVNFLNSGLVSNNAYMLWYPNTDINKEDPKVY